MNELFQFNEDFEIEVSPLVATLKPFQAVLDKYKNRQDGIIELSFITFLLNPKSDFADIREEDKRKEEILKSMVGGDKIRYDKVTEKAIEFYKERSHTTTTKFLDSTLTALDRLGNYFSDVDFTKLDKNGGLKYDPKKLVDVIAASPKLMSSVRELREQIKKEQEIEEGVRGSGQKGIYEDE
jgi:hypothetical protein